MIKMEAAKRRHGARLIILAVLLTGCSRSPSVSAELTPIPIVVDLGGVTAEGRLEPVRYIVLTPMVDGLVSEVLVSEGEQVAAGQLIARLDSSGAETLEAAQAAVAHELGMAYQAARIAQSELDAYPMPRVFVGMTAEEAARKWLEELDAANKAFAPYKSTSRKSLKPARFFPVWVYPSLPQRVLYDTRDYDEMALVYKKRVDVAWMNYKKAVQWLTLDSALVAAEARVADAQRRYDRLRAAEVTDVAAATRSALGTAEIRAPFGGTVSKIDLKLGEFVAAGKPVVTIADFSSWLVKTTDLTEIDVVGVKDGSPVTVILDAMPDKEFEGIVSSVGLDYADRQGDIVYPVKVLLDGTDAAMRWGMTAQVSFK